MYDLEEVNEIIKKMESAAGMREWRKNNPKRYKESQRKWYKENGKEYHREYYRKNNC